MANTVRILITAKDEVSGTFDKIRDKASALSKTDIGKGMAMGAGIAAFGVVKNAAMGALDAVVDFGMGSIKAASALNETISKSGVIFGKNAAEIEEWGGSLASTFALSKQQALDTASGFAGLFKTVGLELDQATDMSIKLTELGADLASFFDTDVESALLALKSGLNGESEPLRKFNVFLSETAVSAKLAEMGIKKVGGQFTEAQKATARYALILEQTGDAQGDMARTSDNYATSMKKLEAEMANLQAELGQELLPVMRDLSKWAVDEGVPALRATIDALKDSEGAIRVLTAIASLGQSEVKNFYDDMAESASASSAKVILAADELGNGVTRNLRGVKGAASGAAGALGGVGDAGGDAAGGIDAAAKAAADAEKAFDDFRKSLEDTLDLLISATFDPEQLALEIKILAAETIDAEKELAGMLGTDGKPKKGTTQRAVDEATLKVSELKEESVRALVKLKALDGLSLQDSIDVMRKFGIKIDYAADRAGVLLSRLTKVGKVFSSGATANALGNYGARAAGGPVAPYSTYLVGERGPELLRMGASGGMVTPSIGGGGGGPGSASLTINVSTPVLTPGGAQALANAIAPSITRWQQARGV